MSNPPAGAPASSAEGANQLAAAFEHELSLASRSVHADDYINNHQAVAPPLHVSTTFRYASDPDQLSFMSNINVRTQVFAFYDTIFPFGYTNTPTPATLLDHYPSLPLVTPPVPDGHKHGPYCPPLTLLLSNQLSSRPRLTIRTSTRATAGPTRPVWRRS